MITITFHPTTKRLVLSFPYDFDIVAQIKKLTGRSYNQSNRSWSIPITSYPELAAVWGSRLDLSISPEAIKAVADYTVFIGQSALRKTATDYTGTLPLFNFQKAGANWLRFMDAALLADEQGTGKTLQAIAALETDTSLEKILILCPATLKYNWHDEIVRWLPDAHVVIMAGTPGQRTALWHRITQHTGRVYVIANYEQLIRDINNFSAIPWHAIVCDEATRIHNIRAQSVKHLHQLMPRKRIALTGTPISNQVADIYGIMQWLHPGYLGTAQQFQDRYYELDYFGNIAGYRNLSDLTTKLEPYILRRTKAEVLDDFPEKTIQQISVELTSQERERYEQIKAEIIEELNDLNRINPETVAIGAVKLLRLKQATDHLGLLGDAYTQPSSKMLLMRDLIEPVIAAGNKVVIFSQFAEMVKLLITYLQDFQPLAIYGAIKQDQRQLAVDTFNTTDTNKVMIMSEAGSMGLNLQKKASYVINYDLPWSYAKFSQRCDRVHRIGQALPVTVYNLIARKTVDEYVNGVLYQKQKLAKELISEHSALSMADIDGILL